MDDRRPTVRASVQILDVRHVRVARSSALLALGQDHRSKARIDSQLAGCVQPVLDERSRWQPPLLPQATNDQGCTRRSSRCNPAICDGRLPVQWMSHKRTTVLDPGAVSICSEIQINGRTVADRGSRERGVQHRPRSRGMEMIGGLRGPGGAGLSPRRFAATFADRVPLLTAPTASSRIETSVAAPTRTAGGTRQPHRTMHTSPTPWSPRRHGTRNIPTHGKRNQPRTGALHKWCTTPQPAAPRLRQVWTNALVHG